MKSCKELFTEEMFLVELGQRDIEVAYDVHTGEPLIRIGNDFVAIEVHSEKHRDKALAFFEGLIGFNWVDAREMSYGTYLIKAEIVERSVALR